MAQDACPICEFAQPTNWMITRLSPPATVLSCEEHIAINLITALAIQLDMPAELLYDIIETSINAPVPDVEPAEEQPAEAKPKRMRKPKLTAEPVQEVTDDAVEAG